MALYDDIREALDQVVDKYKAQVADGHLSFGEVWELFQNATATLVQLVEKYRDYTGEQKKEAVLAALGTFYDEVIRPIDIKGVPNIIEGVVDSALKQLLLTFAPSVINSLVNIFRKTGWGGSEGQTPVAPQGPDDPPDAPADFTPY